MSAPATSWAWSHATTVEGQGQLCVLLAMAEHADPEGSCYPKRKTIAKLCGYKSAGTVTRHINAMIELGLIEKNPRYMAVEGNEEKRRQTSNEYRLKLEVEGIDPGGACATGVAQTATTPDAQVELDGVPAGPPQEPTAKKPSKEPDSSEADCKRIYDHWLALFQPKRPPVFGPPVIKDLRKPLTAFPVETVLLAYDGLFEYRRRKPGETGYTTPFKTHMNSGSMVERLEFFISQAKGATPGGGKYPSAPKAIIAEHQRWVQRGHRLFDNAEAVKRARESEVWLFERGIVTTAGERPAFRARRDADVFQALSIGASS